MPEKIDASALERNQDIASMRASNKIVKHVLAAAREAEPELVPWHMVLPNGSTLHTYLVSTVCKTAGKSTGATS